MKLIIKKYYIIFSIILFLFLTLFILKISINSKIFNKNLTATKSYNKINEKIIYFNNWINFNESDNFDNLNKYMLINKQQKSILIGSNKKELENNYFDFKIFIENQENVIIFLNKLSLNKEEIYNEDYLNKIIKLIIKSFNISTNDLENDKFNELKLQIVDNYKKIRSEYNEKIIVNYKSEIGGVKIEVDNYENMIRISISSI